MDVDVSTSVAGNKPQRIRRIQTVTPVLLFMAGIVNFLDRSSLSVAGEAIRGELGLSATEFGVLLSAFSLSYGFTTTFRYFARPLWPTNCFRRRLNILVINAGINRNG